MLTKADINKSTACFLKIQYLCNSETAVSEIEGVLGKEIGGYLTKLEIENYESLKMIINRDYETFRGLMLERYFRRVLIERQSYTHIGGWWDRKGGNEIDIVAENELAGEATFFEVKRKSGNIDMKLLEQKAATFLHATGAFKGYNISYKRLSMNDL